MQRLARSAHKAVAAILHSDAPLLFPPGVLALAALRSGARSAGLPCAQLLEHVARRAAAARADDLERERRQGEDRETIPGGAGAPPGRLVVPGGGEGAEGLQRLLGWIGEVDALVVAAMKEEEGLEARATETDRKIKLWRKAAAGGGGGGGPAGGATATAAAAAAAAAAASGDGGEQPPR
jgi:hypothetical protein